MGRHGGAKPRSDELYLARIAADSGFGNFYRHSYGKDVYESLRQGQSARSDSKTAQQVSTCTGS
jgi:hypothetical protein